MFLKDIDIEYIQPCIVVPNRIRFKARLTDDITEVMPYLNSVIKNAIYNHEGKLLTFTKEQRLLTLYPMELTVAKALSSTDAYELADWVKNLINETYANKDKIKPMYERRAKPTPLEIYGWLPKKSGCRLCGEPTCLAFAAKLILGEKQLKDCPPIWEPGKEDLLEPLQEIMEALGVSNDC